MENHEQKTKQIKSESMLIIQLIINVLNGS